METNPPVLQTIQNTSSQKNVYKKNSGGLMQKALSFLNTQSEESAQGAIIVKDGIFTINSHLETSSIKVDPKLKSLIDSVLHR